MNIIIIKDRLKNALSVLTRITGNKQSLPILENILIEVKGNDIHITSTDLEIAIRYHVRGKIIQEGNVTVPAETLNKIVSNITHDRLNISKKDNLLNITTDDYDAKINTTSPDDFPIIPEIKEKKEPIIIQSEILKDILQKVISAAQFSDLRPELNSVLMNFSIDMLIFAATDSFRLAEYTLTGNQFNTKKKEDTKLLIPLSTAKHLTSALLDKGEVKIFHDNNQILFETEEFSLISRLVEGNFPEYQNIIPTEFNTEVTVKKENLLNSIKLASVFSGETNDIILRKAGKKQIEIYSQADTKGENISRLPAKIDGEFEKVKFNWKYLSEGVNSLESEGIWVGIVDDNKPALFKSPGDDRFFYLLMPILSEE